MFDGSLRQKSGRPPPQIVPLSPELHRLAVIEERDELLAEMSEGPIPQMRHCNEWGYALLGRGHVLACAGLVPIWPGRAEAWLMVSREATPRDLVPALRRACSLLDDRQRNPRFARIEAYIRWEAPYREGFAHGLGFTLEARLRRWAPDGADYGLYARVKHG